MSGQMKPPSTSPASGSRIKVECAYCGHDMEGRNHKGYTARVHSGLTAKEKPQAKQSTINFKREHSVEEDQSSKATKVSVETLLIEDPVNPANLVDTVG